MDNMLLNGAQIFVAVLQGGPHRVFRPGPSGRTYA
jgi:hypothetical protein